MSRFGPNTERSFEEIVADIERLGIPTGRPKPAPRPKPAVRPKPAGRSKPAAPAEIELLPPAEKDPVLLPLCGPHMRVAVGKTLAVLQLEALKDGQSVLLPLGIDALEALAHAVAEAIRQSIAIETGGSRG